jgi:hypothetical protein
MAKLYRMHFFKVETEYQPIERKYVKKKNKTSPDLKLYVGADGTTTLLEQEISKYWEFGEGVKLCEFAGEMDDSYLKPVLSEPDFVDGQIRSKKNGEIVGYQG